MFRGTCWLLLALSMTTSISAQQTIYWRKDHIYAGPGGKEIAVITPAPADQTSPAAPIGLSATSVTATSVSLSWTASTSADVVGHKIYRRQGSGANLPVGTAGPGPGSLSFTDQPLPPSTSGMTYTIVAFDQAQNQSPPSSSVTVTTSSANDTTAPATPASLTGYLLTRNSVRLTWNRSIDTGGSGISGYKVYRGGALISGGAIPNPAFDDSGLAYNTNLSYTVTAIDGASHESAPTAAFNITTDRELLIQDNFNRLDGALVSPWTASIGSPAFGDGVNYGGPIDGRLKIAGLRLTASAAYPLLSSYYYDECLAQWIEYAWPPSGVWSQAALQPSTNSFKATLDVAANTSGAGIVFYAQPATGQFTDPLGVTATYASSRGYRALLQSGSVILQSCTDLNYLGSSSAVCSTAGSAAGVPTTGTVSVETNASTGSVKVYVNGTLQISATISTGLMSGAAGAASLGYYDYAGGNPTTYHTATLDNFVLERN